MKRRCSSLALGFALAAGAARAEDVLVIRDGTRRPGAVAGCREDACTLDGVAVARGLIAWVGLRQEAGAPPRARDPLKDEVHLVDGRVVTGEFGGLSLGAVAIDDESFDRDEVAWIRFAGPEPRVSPSPSGPVYTGSSPSPRPSPSGPPTPPPAPSPLPSASPEPSPSPRPPNDAAIRPCPAGAPLGGHLVQEQRHRGSSMDCRGKAELWFDLVSDIPSEWPHALQLGHTPTAITYRLDIDGCRPVTGWPEVCTAPAAQASATRRRASPAESLGLYFDPRDPALRFSTLPDEISRGLATTVTCRSPSGSTTGSWTLPIGGAIFPGAVPDVGTHPVPATRCYRSEDPGLQRDCILRPDRYAVIPFTGVATWHRPEPASTSFAEGSTRWNVCCGCGRPDGPPPDRGPSPRPPRPSPSPSFDPCGDLARTRAQVDVLWEYRQLIARELERAWRELESAHGALLDNHEAWLAANPICAIADVVQTVLTEAAGEFGEALDLAAQIAEGDLSYLIEDDDLSAALEVLGGVREAAGAADPGNMRDRIAGCAALPEDLRRGANAFVDAYERVLRAMPQVQRHINDIRVQDQKYWDEWNRYYRECARYARCKGLPAPPCPPPPETPSGPMPPH